MIRVEIKKIGDSVVGLYSKGHAPKEFGEKGNNVLCAAVSSLLQTLLLYLKKEKLVSAHTMKPGFLDFSLLEKRNPRAEIVIEHAFSFVYGGLENLQAQYPNEIELKTVIIS